MTLRLVLVSMVAALGLTIPSRVECKRFIGLAEARASSFLAGWDTWRPGDGVGHKKLSATATRECELCRQARLAAALRAQKQAAEVAIDSTKTFSVPPPVADGGVPNEQTVVRSRTANDVDLMWVDEVCGKLIRDVRTAAMAAQASNPAAESLASTPMDDQPEPLAVQTAADNKAETPSEVATTSAETTSAEWCGLWSRSFRCNRKSAKSNCREHQAAEHSRGRQSALCVSKRSALGRYSIPGCSRFHTKRRSAH